VQLAALFTATLQLKAHRSQLKSANSNLILYRARPLFERGGVRMGLEEGFTLQAVSYKQHSISN